jgi:hypothetical protein
MEAHAKDPDAPGRSKRELAEELSGKERARLPHGPTLRFETLERVREVQD